MVEFLPENGFVNVAFIYSLIVGFNIAAVVHDHQGETATSPKSQHQIETDHGLHLGRVPRNLQEQGYRGRAVRHRADEPGLLPLHAVDPGIRGEGAGGGASRHGAAGRGFRRGYSGWSNVHSGTGGTYSESRSTTTTARCCRWASWLCSRYPTDLPPLSGFAHAGRRHDVRIWNDAGYADTDLCAARRSRVAGRWVNCAWLIGAELLGGIMLGVMADRDWVPALRLR